MNTELNTLLDSAKIVGKRSGVYLTDLDLRDEVQLSQPVWEKLHDFDGSEFERDRSEFFQTKLEDHLDVMTRFRKFTAGDIYLEIGCGPAYVGEYLMRQYGIAFIGIDFNLKLLQIVKLHLDRLGLHNHLLIHADINSMPLRDGVIDYIYGGGVIEHVADTNNVLVESRRVLKHGGVSFNTVPAFNVSWLALRSYNNIPAVRWLRRPFTFMHTNVWKNRLLERSFGYELSFTRRQLLALHRRAGFRHTTVGPFPFHPSAARLPSPRLADLYFRISSRPFLAPVYYAAATA